MALEFKKLRSPLLGMLDTIITGKLSGCRVCDCIPDHYEYLIWAEKSGFLKFQGIVTETIAEHAGFKAQQRHYEEEVAPWKEEPTPVLLLDDDVPF